MAKLRVKYLYLKDGTYYYQRRIPDDLKAHFPPGRIFIRHPLHTADPFAAAPLIPQHAKHDDLLFQRLRSHHPTPHVTSPPSHSSPHQPKQIPSVSVTRTSKDNDRVLLSEVLALYLAEHRHAGNYRFRLDTNRALNLVLSNVGDFPLQDYTRDDARLVRDKLITDHSSATVRRRLASINAVFNSGRREFDIQCLNPFEKMVIPHEGHDTIKRVPFTIQELRTISAACRKLDDDIRWIVGLQLATGARLAEIVGLRKEDILFHTTSSIPFIFIRQHLSVRPGSS